MIPSSILDAERFCRHRLFDTRTDLFYDFLVSDEPDALTCHLPSPALINLQIPNPCGWGTGMEDSMLSAGSALDAIVARHHMTGEEKLKSDASHVFAGMLRCADASRKPGFLPRSVSPVDGVSHYSNSSRDQYTHWIYAAWRFYTSPLSDDTQKAAIRRVLTAFSQLFEREITPENDYSLLREDDQPALVQKMWGELSVHEYLRLPMLYAATWYVTGEEHWLDAYLTFRDAAIDGSSHFDALPGRSYTALQMQYSLRLLYEIDPDPSVRKKLLTLMEKLARSFRGVTVRDAQTLLKPENAAHLNFIYVPWDAIPNRYVGTYGGKPYFNPAQSELPENVAFYGIRGVGEAVSVIALCPTMRVDDAELAAITSLAERIDYNHHRTYAPLLLVCGYFLGKENQKRKEL